MEESISRNLVLELVDEGRLSAEEALVLLLALAGREDEAARKARCVHPTADQENGPQSWSGAVCL